VEGETTVDYDSLSFSDALEESFKSYGNDQKVKGVVVAVNPSEVQVDIGRKHTGYVSLSELTADSTKTTNDVVKVGDVIDLIIMKTNDMEGTVMLSKRRFDAQKGWEEVCAAAEENSDVVLSGTVSEILKGGVLVTTDKSVRVFIPASLATLNRGDSLEELKGKRVDFKIIEVNRQRKRAVGSIKALLREKRKENVKQFWQEIEVGKEYEGTVKSILPFGAFVDIGVKQDGLVHVSKLANKYVRHPSEVVAVGDSVKVWVTAVDKERGKVGLSMVEGK
jgi:4-hydroxy-3-methylbut-2-enyl diphosphate reductase